MVGWLLLAPGMLAAQPRKKISLDEACRLAQQNYPLVKQKDLVKQTAALTVENLSKGLLPQVSISGQASYQSDVTRIDVSLPGFSFEPPSRDQYKLVADVSQLLFDGGLTREQKTVQQLNAAVEESRVDVELYKVQDRVSQVYLSVLYLDQQLKQVELVKADIGTGIRKVDAMVQNGTAFRSGLSMLQAEQLKAEQRAIEIRASRQGMIDVLALFLGQALDSAVVFERPTAVTGLVDSPAVISRPELKLFAGQSRLALQQQRLLQAKTLPKASLFVQSGYGKPGLNFLKNSFDFYYIGGLRLNWSLGGYYTIKKEKQLVALNKQNVDLQQETFLLNTRTQLKQQESEIGKLRRLIATDTEIIRLRHSVTDAAKAQLDNGVITAGDFLREVNAEDQARQALIAHEVQLLQAQINYKTTSGN